MERIGQSARGVVRAEVFGAFPEGLLNLAAGEGIELWDVERRDGNTLRFCLYEGRLVRLESLAHKSGCELSVLSSRGGRAALHRVRRRLWLLIGLALALAGVTLSSLFIWRIELHGTERLSRTQVLRALEDCGVGVGCFWPDLDPERVRSEMMLRLPEIAWMAVNVSGSRATVAVAERQLDRGLVGLFASELGDSLLDRGIDRRVDCVDGRHIVLRDENRYRVLLRSSVNRCRLPAVEVREPCVHSGYDLRLVTLVSHITYPP